MKIHTLQTECWLPAPRARVFAFFADAYNLEAITPPWLQFAVRTPRPITMQVGALIRYGLRLHGIPLRWLTEITCWEPPFRFVDEQRRGPYRLWIHTHTFLEQHGGTSCRDEVKYAVPGGRLVNALFIQRQVQAIFAYRQEAIRRQFASDPARSSLVRPEVDFSRR